MTDPMSPEELKALLEGAATGPTSATFDHVLGQAQQARRTRWTLATAAVVILVAAAVVLPIALRGSSSPATKSVGHHHQITTGPPDNADPGDVFELVNRWTVDAPGADGVTMVLGDAIDGGAVLFEPCGEMEGSWTADPAGDFLAAVNGGAEKCFNQARDAGKDPTSFPWLDQATSFTITDDGAELNGASGNVLARLTPSTTLPPHSTSASDDYRVPKLTSDLRRQLSAPAPLPSSLTPVTAASILGWWDPTDTDNPAAYLSFQSDRDAVGSDGCNGAGGRYLVGADGGLLTVSGGSTLVGCNSSRVVGDFDEAHRAGLDDSGDLVLTDQSGAVLGRLTKVPTGHVTGTFESVGGPLGASKGPDSGSIMATRTGEPVGVTTYATAIDGSFALDLPPGSYRLSGNSAQFIIDGTQATCRAENAVQVTAGATVTADVLCQRK